ncbi:MAG: hypothetical protein GX413_01095 [Acetobacter sp.]|nr:hypothetical protein [Acetobacter sp.]
MKRFLKKYATPFTTGLFLISGVSGVALFFHWKSVWFHSMHVWLSMVLLLPAFLHIWRNWNAFCGYFRNKSVYIPLLISIAAAAPFMINAMRSGGERPGAMVFRLLTNAPVSQLAPVLHLTPEQLTDRLAAMGYTDATVDKTLVQIAGKSDQEASAVLMRLAPGKK